MLNGLELATVSSDGLSLLSLRVHGDRISPEFASIEISGGLYGDEVEHKHLIWESDRIIAPGDEVSVTFLETAISSRSGKTIDELYADEDEPQGPWQPIEQMFQNIAQRPKVRDRFSFLIHSSSSEPMSFETLPDDHSFGFSATWIWMHPERLRISLNSNTLENIAKREGGTDHASFRMQYGDQVKFRVDS